MNADEARAITYAAEDLAHDEYESNMAETLNTIYAKIKEAAGKRKYDVTISYEANPNPKNSNGEQHWIGNLRVLQYEGTWPDCWSVLNDTGKDLCQRLSAQNFSATIDRDCLKIEWKPSRPRNETESETK